MNDFAPAPSNDAAKRPFKRRGVLYQALRVANLAVFVTTLFLVGRFIFDEWRNFSFEAFHPNFAILAAALSATLGYMALYALGWWLILRATGSQSKLAASSAIWGISTFGKYVPGKIATLAYRTLMISATGSTSPQQVVLAWTVESITTVLGGVLALALVMMLVGVNELAGGIQLRDIIIIGLVAIICAVAGLSHPVRSFAFRRLGLETAVDNVRTITFIGMTTYYACCWFVLGTVFWLITWAFGVGGLDIRSATLICTFAGIAGMLSVLTPSGLGVREGAMILMLVAFMPEGHAAAVALCARLMSTAGDGAAVAIGFGMAKVLGLERAANVEGKNDTNGG